MQQYLATDDPGSESDEMIAINYIPKDQMTSFNKVSETISLEHVFSIQTIAIKAN